MQTTIRNLRQENNYYYDRLDRISKQVHQQELLKAKDICAPIQASIFNMPNKTSSMAKSKLLEAGMLTNRRSTERVGSEPSPEPMGYGFDANDNTSRQEKLSSKEKDNLAKTSEFASRAKIGLANDSMQPFAHTTGGLELFWKFIYLFIIILFIISLFFVLLLLLLIHYYSEPGIIWKKAGLLRKSCTCSRNTDNIIKRNECTHIII